MHVKGKLCFPFTCIQICAPLDWSLIVVYPRTLARWMHEVEGRSGSGVLVLVLVLVLFNQFRALIADLNRVYSLT